MLNEAAKKIKGVKIVENFKTKNVKVEWRMKLFTHVDSDTPPPRQKLFSHVEPGEKLLEHLDDRLIVKENGEIGLKKDYGDGIYPVFIGTAPIMEENATEIKHPPVSKVAPAPLSLSVVTDIGAFASGNFGLKLLAVTKRIEETADKEICSIAYEFSVQTQWGQYRKEVAAENLEDFTWVREATEGRAFFSERKDRAEFAAYVHEVIEKEIDGVERRVVYGTNGWKKIGEKYRYVCDSGVVGNRDIIIRAAYDMKFEIAKNMSRRESIQQFWGMERICRRMENAHMLMTFASMSVLTTIFKAAGFPIKFLLGVFGTTNTLKTSVAMVFSKIFNAQEQTDPEVTFTSTVAGIETFVAKYSDAILLVDDFMPGSGNAKQSELDSKFEFLSRAYGDRTAKKRMTVFAKQDVEYPVRGCCMVTGELVTGVQSSRTRVLNIKFEQGDVDKEILTYYQENPLILPTFLYGFIDFITQNQTEVIKLIKQKMKMYRRMLNFSIARLNESAAHSLTTLDVLGLYWKKELPEYDIDNVTEVWAQGILMVFGENDRRLANTDMATVILQALEEAMQNFPEKVKDVELLCKDDDGMIYLDSEHIYVQQKSLYQFAKSYCNKFDIEFVKDVNMIVEKLKEKNLLDYLTNSKGHAECARKLKQSKGNTKRFLYLKRKVMEAVLEKAR